MLDKIHVVITRFDLSDDYNRHAGATMVSILEHSSKPVVFHITHEGKLSFKNMVKTNENIKKYEIIVSKYHDSSVVFHDVDEYIQKINIPQNILDTWPSFCITRLLFQNIFPDLSQIILFGADTIVLTDIAKLLEITPKTHSIAAVSDSEIEFSDVKFSTKIANPNLKKYINVDVCIFNLDKIRLDNIIIEKSNDFFSKVNIPTLVENDTLNYVFQDDIYYLPNRYNVYPYEKHSQKCITKENNDDFIIHFAGEKKPWKQYNGYYDDYYWQYLQQTPWGENIMEYLRYIRNAPDMTIATNYLQKNFFAWIDGTKREKIFFAIRFIFSIIRSAIRSIVH